MSDIAITAASVLASANVVQKFIGVAGAAITAGQALYKDTANGNVLKLADAITASPANIFAGFALHAAATGQPINYVYVDPNFIFGGAAAVGDTIWMSGANAGGVTSTVGDLATGWMIWVLGVCNLAGAAGTATINLNPTQGAVHA